MITDPYEVLGVSKDATPEEIKRAYHKKAKEYHPDLHPGDAAAAKKMNEVNEAYDMLTNPGKYAHRTQQHAQGAGGNRQSGPYGQRQENPYGRYQGPGGWSSDFDFDFEDIFGFGFGFGGDSGGARIHCPKEQAGDSPAIRRIIEEINSCQYQQAVNRLAEIPSEGRNARWYYLSGLAHHGLGNTLLAVEQMQRAVQLDPDNQIYHRLLQQYRQAGQTYQQTAGNYAADQQVMQRMCLGLCAAQFFCYFCRC